MLWTRKWEWRSSRTRGRDWEQRQVGFAILCNVIKKARFFWGVATIAPLAFSCCLIQGFHICCPYESLYDLNRLYALSSPERVGCFININSSSNTRPAIPIPLALSLGNVSLRRCKLALRACFALPGFALAAPFLVVGISLHACLARVLGRV